MDTNNDTTQKSGFISSIRAAFERFTMRKAHRSDLPYIPHPGQTLSSPTFDFDSDYTETETDVQPLYGTSIIFGTQESTHIDEHGRPKTIKRNPSYIIGTKKRVSNIENIDGVCEFCEMKASQDYSDGKITLQQAQLNSLYDVKSARQCDICGIYTCSRHCRQIRTPEGLSSICTSCQDDINRQQKKAKIIGFLLSPFMKTQNSEEE